MSRLNLDRATLASLLQGNPRAIAAFEKMLSDVGGTLPDTIEEANALAAQALAAAQVALSMLAMMAEALAQLEGAPATPPHVDADDHTPRTHLGTISSQNADQIEVTGGTIDGTPIGQTTAAASKFTTLAASDKITIGTPAAQASVALSAKQLVNGGDGIVLQRQTDTAPTGYVMRVVNAANSSNLAMLDVAGNANVQNLTVNTNATIVGLAKAQTVRLTGGAVAGSASDITLGNTLAAAATAGTSGAAPAQVAGYIVALVGSTTVKIPYYND